MNSSSLLAISLLLACSLAGSHGSPQLETQTSELGYHSLLPTEPLPPTLDPEQFRGDRNAFAAYTVAGQAKAVLYQVPCLCPCQKLAGHQSLLDCFVGRHGVHCHICQQEAVFCFLQTKKGKSPARIREAIAAKSFNKFDYEKYIARHFGQIEAHTK
jgi:hypothetical protein